MSDDNNLVCAISQVNISFATEQDRLLFAMNTTDEKQFRFYFTRRWLKLFWPNLVKVLESEVPSASFDEKSRDAAAAFQHESAMIDADYQTPFKTEGFEYPWGEEPLLATEVRFRNPPMEQASIGIYAANGVGLEFNNGHKILHYLYQILPEATDRAGWDLDLKQFSSALPGFADKARLN